MRRSVAWLVALSVLAVLAALRLADTKERHGPPAAEEGPAETF